MWSVGCILAELLGGKPFFKGRDYVDQLNQILHYLGTPDESTLSRIGSPRAQEYVRNLPRMPKVTFQHLFRGANPDALDLLDRMLAFDPTRRLSVEQALEHRYLQIWHDASDEPGCPTTFDFAFEVVDDVAKMRQMIYEEVKRFRAHVRQTPQEMVPQMGVPAGAVGAQGQAAGGGMGQQGQVQGQNGVPMPPMGYDAARHEDPRPEQYDGMNAAGLEQELHGGLDAMR